MAARPKLRVALFKSRRGWRLYAPIALDCEITDHDAARWSARDALDTLIKALQSATIEIVEHDPDPPPGEDPT